MNAEIRQWIWDTVSGYYPQRKLDVAIDSLDRFFDVSKDFHKVDWEQNYIDISHANDFTRKQYVKNFTNIEQFMKELAEVLWPGRLDNTTPYGMDSEWTMSPLYKKMYRVVDTSINLGMCKTYSDIEKYKNSGNNMYHYLYLYVWRNGDTHNQDWNMSNRDVIVSMIIVELDLCLRYEQEIKTALSNRKLSAAFSKEKYAIRIKEEYESTSMNIQYIDIPWNDYSDNPTDTTVSDIITSNNNKILLLGDPGAGKSTALRQIEYIYSKRILEKKSDIIPVFIELINIKDRPQIIIDMLSEDVLLIPQNLCEYMLKEGKVCLLLDGYNEISDMQIKRKVSVEVDSIISKYPKTRIILSERRLSKNTIPIMNNAKPFCVKPLSIEFKNRFIQAYCDDDVCRDLIVNKLKTDESYFETINTPLKVINLIEIVQQTQSLPDFFIKGYIELLFDRERFKKKDNNMRYLKEFLEAFAIQQEEDDNPVHRNLVLSKCFKKCKDIMGYEMADTSVCLDLMIDMRILISEEDLISFASKEYQEYFYFEAVMDHLEELMNE